MSAKKAKKSKQPPPQPQEPRLRVVLIACGLAVLTLLVFGQTVTHDFVNLDDNVYVYDNPAVTDGLSLKALGWAFSTFWQVNWHPLTWISLMTDAQIDKWTEIGNPRAGVYHLTNTLLHVGSTVVLFLALRMMSGMTWRSAFAAAMFGIHPMHVESVAWVAERKDVLSTLFWMLTMLAYARYARRPGVPAYLAVVLLYALGLMSKPMLVSLPLVLLLMDLWPLGRFRVTGGRERGMPDTLHPTPDTRPLTSLILEKIPLFAMSAASCVVTVVAQQSERGVVPFDMLPLGIRLANASYSYVAYVLKMLWPAGLACMYPHPENELPTWAVVAATLALVSMTAVAIKAAKNRPYVTAGWLWYVITLLPVCGLIQVGRQAMADRYSYVPLTGIFLLIAWLVPELVRIPRLLAGAAALAIVACTVTAYRQTSHWRDSVALMTHATQVTRNNFVAENNLAQALSERQDMEGAMVHVLKALEYNPNYVDALFNYGTLLALRGDFAQARPVFEKIIWINPRHYGAHNNLGRVFIALRLLEPAIEHFRAATEIQPTNEDARYNLERALAMKRAGLR